MNNLTANVSWKTNTGWWPVWFYFAQSQREIKVLISVLQSREYEFCVKESDFLKFIQVPQRENSTILDLVSLNGH